MKNVQPNKYLETLAKVGGAMDDEAKILAPEGAEEHPSYNNYTPVSNRANSYGQNEGVSYSGKFDALFSRAIRDSQNEGKIYSHSANGSYLKHPNTVNYKMWYVPGAIVQRAVMEKELKGWTPIFPANIWLNRDLSEESNAKEKEAVAHERVHRKDWNKGEIDVRKEMQGWLLTYRGTIADTLHEDRYA